MDREFELELLEHHLYSMGMDDEYIKEKIESLEPIDTTQSPDFCTESEEDYNKELLKYKRREKINKINTSI